MTDLLHYVIYPTPNQPDTLGEVREVGGHLDWHMDIGQGNVNRRKLATTVQLSDPDEYEGGDLIFKDYHNREVIAPKEKGTIIVFDSRVPHKVTRVTTGRRVSIVTWMYGPKLR